MSRPVGYLGWVGTPANHRPTSPRRWFWESMGHHGHDLARVEYIPKVYFFSLTVIAHKCHVGVTLDNVPRVALSAETTINTIKGVNLHWFYKLGHYSISSFSVEGCELNLTYSEGRTENFFLLLTSVLKCTLEWILAVGRRIVGNNQNYKVSPDVSGKIVHSDDQWELAKVPINSYLFTLYTLQSLISQYIALLSPLSSIIYNCTM